MHQRWLSLPLLSSCASAFYPYTYQGGDGADSNTKRFIPIDVEQRPSQDSPILTLDIKKIPVSALVDVPSTYDADDLPDKKRQYLHRHKFLQTQRSQCHAHQPGRWRLHLFLDHEVRLSWPGYVHVDRHRIRQHLGHGFRLCFSSLSSPQHLWFCQFQDSKSDSYNLVISIWYRAGSGHHGIRHCRLCQLFRGTGFRTSLYCIR